MQCDAGTCDLWVGNENRADEGVGVVVPRLGIEVVWRRHFANFAEVHHHDASADCFDHCKVMRDENERETVTLFHVGQEV